VITHLRDEYSTWEWVMEELLTRAGFAIDHRCDQGQMGLAYLCTRRD